ncbi:type II toxin-antitoxin system RelB/DinJ family antitoxin [Thermophilibacter provencensis]|uniref:Type II toxin-antitoxin system RelB/DinJ family antitoxin n=1 Tax=Thermophilibacter provencensis TaxID=1852386 RepID=A0ABT7V288_9ACTN|nr:type II toxin-antitoxin system RelB/DinJ family antitoxin [Thermophilibacter provencensis]MDM8270096.1 type II toxin-antitoxin system RelB/DinJ family antitoxin [Thermophilibacter provencensis]
MKLGSQVAKWSAFAEFGMIDMTIWVQFIANLNRMLEAAMSSQLATRVEDAEAARFREITRLLGTTPADAMRIFVSAFNAHRGFPFEVRLAEPEVEAFTSEQEAAEFSNRLALRMMSDAR